MTSTSRDFGIFLDGKEFLMHDLPGAPVCEFFHWREGSLILLLRIVPAALQPTEGFITSYQLELFAGPDLTVIPPEDFQVQNYEWKLIGKETGYRKLWDRFDRYRREIARHEGVFFCEDFIGEWTASDGNMESLLAKLEYRGADNREDYLRVGTCVIETAIASKPEPCDRCEFSHVEAVYEDGGTTHWCDGDHEEYWGDPDCPYISGISEEEE